ncbi:hypothetical protein [Streptomyces hydrogenans]|uniref:Secreted protein n=1 Tax=Streptomyces hydrogenans TaxID=1873719 RepID=A0ABQ3PMJ2_9ACTN|nr:hypothetical protein [Streptomyces hydrogenans]GHE31951.1 hypothetical protein GCM10018784_80620 [Streptomyces hydrogenans]GHI26229.1 hypothetical protein Shyd_76000 [Streptomyces hydrogenans]
MSISNTLQLLLAHPATPFALALMVMFAIDRATRAWTFHVSMRGAPPAERPAIMREHKNMWQIRRKPPTMY